MTTGIIILAAGNSSRLGKPKQLLTYSNKTLLNIVSDEALKTECRPIIVVIGAYAAEISQKHNRDDITYVINNNWKNGIASSISVGITSLLAIENSIENVIIAVADQVFINDNIFKKLIEKQQVTNKGIIASGYAETIGTPVLFSRKYFDQLLALTGNTGAKKIVQNNLNDSEVILFDKGEVDIDTEQDYYNLINNK